MAVINELVTVFSFEGDLSPFENYNSLLNTGIGTIGAFTLAIAGSALAISAWTISVNEAVTAQLYLSQRTNESIETLQELGYAAGQSSSSSEELESTILSLSDSIGKAATSGADNFTRLGISIRDEFGRVKNASTVLLEVGQRLRNSNFSIAEQRDLASSLGINPNTLQLITKSRTEIEALRQDARALGVTTKEEAEAAVALNDSYERLRFGFEAVKRVIATSLSPEVQNITDSYTDWIKENKVFIKEVVDDAIVGIGKLGDMFERVSPILGPVVAGLVAVKAVFLVLGSAVILTVAAISAIVLIIDDLVVAFNGGQSAIADFVQEFFGIDIQPVLVQLVDDVQKFTEDVVNEFLMIGKFAGEIWDNLSIENINSFFADISDSISQYFSGLYDEIYAAITQPFVDAFSFIDNALTTGGEFVSSLNPFANDDVANNVVPINAALAGAVGGSVSNSFAPVNTYNISGGNAEEIARRIEDRQQQQQEDAQTILGRGGRG